MIHFPSLPFVISIRPFANAESIVNMNRTERCASNSSNCRLRHKMASLQWSTIHIHSNVIYLCYLGYFVIIDIFKCCSILEMDGLDTQGWIECENDDDDSSNKKIDKKKIMEFYSFILLCYRMATKHVKSFLFVKKWMFVRKCYLIWFPLYRPLHPSWIYDTLVVYTFDPTIIVVLFIHPYVQ